ncbi:MAG: 2,3-oxidosqualene cyclase [Deltaproteobacteria bacterium]|nr:2,3-oxidosqualene cyclase [Deltaproteobacteria bacterium]
MGAQVPRLDASFDAGLTLQRSLDHLARVQRDRGCWVGEVVWCTMLPSQYVIVAYLTRQPLDPARREKLLKYYRAWQLGDGGFGLHRESPGYVFVTALAYVALRLLGLGPDDEPTARARAWLRAHGGVKHVPSWGKLWLALLNLYGWEGVNPIPPEVWLLPAQAPVHPRRMYNHTRLIYLGLGYLYGRRFTGPLTPLIEDLRRELYDEPYGSIDFAAHRHDLAPTDVYVPPARVLHAAYDAAYAYEGRHSRWLRRRALDACFERILFELRSTRYACVSPVNGLLHVLAVWDRDPAHADFLPAWKGVDYWSWEDEEEGLRFNGAHSHTWDTAFTVQAIRAGPPAAAARLAAPLRRACRYLRDSQMREEIPDRERWFRDRRLGGWCFSDEHHQWPVSDCTAEAITAALAAAPHVPADERIPDRWLDEAAAFVLSRQNDDGGFGSYERNRGTLALEAVNPSEMFGNCMVELSYVECTASCVKGLARFRAAVPASPRRGALDRALQRGIRFLLDAQRPDGSWEGFWGINFTYAIMYAVEGLRAAGVPAGHPAIRRACDWLISKQRPDGGWGEHYTSCLKREYVEHERSQVIMTAWALMALLAAEDPRREAIERGVRLLAARQRDGGDFPKEGVGGVFFNTAMHHYCLYKDTFSAWALGRYERARQGTRSGVASR